VNNYDKKSILSEFNKTFTEDRDVINNKEITLVFSQELVDEIV
jgi:hypothetical protein